MAVPAVDSLTLDLGLLAPAGHYLALRVGFAFPLEEENRFPRPWVEDYARHGHLPWDPLIRWIYGAEGSIRWSEVALPDPRGVLDLARRHGLAFGAAVSVLDGEEGGPRSYGLFARPDREFLAEEIALLAAHVEARHRALSPPRNLTLAELEALRLVKDGQRLKQIAHRLGVTEGAIKQRLKNARHKLRAKTGAEAISRAVGFGLI
ncbi:helix-turn-helix transcriptional regulator [Rubellimicrobium aerolatum]|uniref:Helix-turn-helix transcriptional regulator n=1 Tax=Rubellimicrobium aerolatum TaxID=490979 RepID=A0ABW0SBF3_9RHOB|nr:autoinducer binding domain-containing protein [Rubellimicrobium aerolatum]MBP1805536.1 LuxR family transcriptional regulator [Rubellimicrobium aerolatum]